MGICLLLHHSRLLRSPIKFCCCTPEACADGRLGREPRVLVLMHHKELEARRVSNTAKVLVCAGAELFVWGHAPHDLRVQQLISQDPDGTVVLFPAPGSVQAADLSTNCGGALRAEQKRRVRCIIVPDGGWKETRKINQWI